MVTQIISIHWDNEELVAVSHAAAPEEKVRVTYGGDWDRLDPEFRTTFATASQSTLPEIIRGYLMDELATVGVKLIGSYSHSIQ